MPTLYRDFTTQAELDAQYDVEKSVPDFMVYARHYIDESKLGAASPALPARRAVRTDPRRAPRHLSGRGSPCADPDLHPRRLLAHALQQGIQLRGVRPRGGGRDRGQRQLFAVPEGDHRRDQPPGARGGRMDLSECRVLRRRSGAHLPYRSFRGRTPDGHVSQHRLACRVWTARGRHQGCDARQRFVRYQADPLHADAAGPPVHGRPGGAQQSDPSRAP